jgi:hypothetical protein
MEPPRTRSLREVLEGTKKTGKSWQDIERETLMEKRSGIRDFSSIDQSKRKLWQNKKFCEEPIAYSPFTLI